jgi:hypothetical protein
MTDWGRRGYRLLFKDEGPGFSSLRAAYRGFAALMIRFCSDEGTLPGDHDSLCRKLGCHRTDKKLLRDATEALLADGYLVRNGEFLVIRNFAPAQARKATKGKAANGHRTERERAENGHRTERQRNVNGHRTSIERTQNEHRTDTERTENIDLNARNHSGSNVENLALPRAKDQIRSDHKTKIRSPLTPPGEFRESRISELAQEESAEVWSGTVDGQRRLMVAYCKGVSSAIAAPSPAFRSPTDTQALTDACLAFSGGVSGADLETWVESTATLYVDATREAVRYQSGYRPTQFLVWLRSGRPKLGNNNRPVPTVPELSTGSVYVPPTREQDPERYRRLAEMTEEEFLGFNPEKEELCLNVF